MGKQFQVYLLPSDAEKLIENLRGKVNLTLIAPRSERPSHVEVSSPLVVHGGFTRADCLLAPDLSASVRMEHVAKQDYWSVDTLESEVIEFEACYFDEKTIKRGRLFYDPGFYRERAWVNKSEKFLSWAERVFTLSRKLLNRHPELNAYVGQDAESWRRTGGVFVEFAASGKRPIIAPASKSDH